jgi:hypothetical protein
MTQHERGSSLIAICLLIILLSGAGLYLLKLNDQVADHNLEAVTYEKELEVRKALQAFVQSNGRYPCPAPLNAAYDTPGFGVEPADANVVGDLDGDGEDDNGYQCNGAPLRTDTAGNQGEFVVIGSGGASVRVGALPVRTIGLPDDFIADEYDTRFVYAVTESYADENGAANGVGGAIDVQDASATSVLEVGGTAVYALMTPKGDPNGTYHANGTLNAPCAAGGNALAAQNCSYMLGANATFRTAVAKSTNENNFYRQNVDYKAQRCDAGGAGDDPFADVTFIIDTSGSMKEQVDSKFCPPETGTKCTRIELARWALRRIVPQVIAKDYATAQGGQVDKVNFTGFMKQGSPTDEQLLKHGQMKKIEMDIAGKYDNATVGPKSNGDFDAIVDEVDKRLNGCPNGNTPLGQHIEALGKEMVLQDSPMAKFTDGPATVSPVLGPDGKVRKNKIIVLSDGYHNGGSDYNLNKVSKRFKDIGDLNNTEVDIIDMTGKHSALKNATTEGGSFYSVKDAKELLDAFSAATGTCATFNYTPADKPGACGDPK